ncbi:MAG: saccharopine dehydrogenase family protein [Nocardioides sp.]
MDFDFAAREHLQVPTESHASRGSHTVLVYGAYGLTGRFVVTELIRRGLTPVLAGRSADGLAALAELHPDLHVRRAAADDPESLDLALVGVDAVINCAGPFLDTAMPVAEAALRSKVSYLDIAAEQPSTTSLFSDLDARAGTAGVTALPAMGFFGALADLLATLTMGDWPDADSIEIATALEGWRPTAGTLMTGTRNVEPHRELRAGRLTPNDPSRVTAWDFPPPFGRAELVPLSLGETVLLSQHLKVPEIRAGINSRSLEDLADPDLPRRTAGQDRTPVQQAFVIDVAVTRGTSTRRGSVHGNDIYGVTAPIVVEATVRLLAGLPSGVLAAGAAFDPAAFLDSLPVYLTRDGASHPTEPSRGSLS